MRDPFFTLLLASSLLSGCAGHRPAAVLAGGDSADEAAAVARVLDDWHRAASLADEPRYFGHFAPDAVFLGTDAEERWTVDEFRAYAHPHFSAGRGWTYRPSARHVVFSPDGRTAWFDERLDSEKYGELRGTGVLGRVDGRWRIVQYSMTFTVPNEVAAEVVETIGGRRGNRTGRVH